MAPKPRVFNLFGEYSMTYYDISIMLDKSTAAVRQAINDQYGGNAERYLESIGIRDAQGIKEILERNESNARAAAVDAICDVLKDAKPKLNVSADDTVEVETDDPKPSNEDDLGAEAEVRYVMEGNKPTPEKKGEREKSGGFSSVTLNEAIANISEHPERCGGISSMTMNEAIENISEHPEKIGGTSSMTMDEAITNISECLGKVFSYGRQEERAAKDAAIEATPEADVPDAEITYTAGEIEEMIQNLIKRDIPTYTAAQHKLIKLNQIIRLLDDEDVVEMCEAHGVNNISVAAFDLKTVRMGEFGAYVNWDEIVRFVED